MPKTPIDRITLQALRASSALLRNPRRTLAGAAAALIAPAFFSNDDRGYFATSLVTTPLVVGAAAAMPNIFGQSQLEASRIISFAKQSRKAVSYDGSPSLENLRSMAQDSAVPWQRVEQQLGEYVRSGAPAAGLKNYEKIRAEANNLFSAMTTVKEGLEGEEAVLAMKSIEGRRRLLSNALEGARRGVLTPREWDMEADRTMSVGTYSIEEMNKIFSKYIDRDEFAEDVVRRLRQVTDHFDEGGVFDSFKAAASAESQISRSSSNELVGLAESAINDAEWGPAFVKDMARLEKQRPEVARLLEKARRERKIAELHLISEKVTSGETGRVLQVGIRLPDAKDVISFPVVDTASGQVRMGRDGSMVGVGRRVIDAEHNPHWIDEWVAHIVNQGGYDVEALKEEIAAGAYFRGMDPLDSTWVKSGMTGTSEYDALAIKLRSHAAFITKQPVFGGQKFTDRAKVFQNSFKRSLVEPSDGVAKFANIGPESGPAEGIFYLADLENLSLSGLAPLHRQEELYRAMAKEVHLSANAAGEAYKTSVSNAALEKLLGSNALVDKYQVGGRFAGIPPELKSIFGDLTGIDSIRSVEGRAGLVDKFQALGYNHVAANKAVDAIQTAVRGERDVESLKQLGWLGEADFMMRPEYVQGLNLETTSRYQVSDLFLKTEGNDLKSLVGRAVNRETTLGSTNGDLVRPDFAGIIEGAFPHLEGTRESGMVDLVIKHTLPTDVVKYDISGVKGQGFTGQAFDFVRETLNNTFQALGLSNYIDEDVSGIADLSYFQKKIPNPYNAMQEITGDVISRMQRSGGEAAGLAEEYLQQVSDKGISFDRMASKLVIDPTASSRDAASKRMIDIAQITRDFFDGITDRMIEAKGWGDRHLANFANAAMIDPKANVLDWMYHNSFNGIVRAWGSPHMYLPSQVAVTPDMFMRMNISGDYAALSQIKNRLRIPRGSQKDALDLAKHMFGGNEGVLGAEVGVNDLFPNLGRSGSLRFAKARKGSVLDPELAQFRKPFTVNLGEEGEVKRLFVPGTDTLGGSSSLFAPGEYETMDWQKALVEVSRAKGVEARDLAAKKFRTTVTSELFTGKHKALTPKSYDPLALPGYLRTRPSPNNPWQVGISPEDVENIADRALRTRLKRGRSVTAKLSRHPISFMPGVEVMMDPNVQAGGIGIDEAIRAPLFSDDDLDLSNLHFLKGKAEKEARKAISDVSSYQSRRLAYNRALFGRTEESRAPISRLPQLPSSLTQMVERDAADLLKIGESTATRTSAGAIGSLSNSLTRVLLELEHSPGLMRNRESLALFEESAFLIRQSAIWARKSAIAGNAPFDIERALDYTRRVNDALDLDNKAQGAGQLQSVFKDLSSEFIKPRAWDEDMLALGIQKKEGLINISEEVFGGTKRLGMFEKFMENRSGKYTRELIRNITSESDYVVKMTPELHRSLQEAVQPYMRAEGGMSEVAASELGAINRTIEAAKDTTRLGKEGLGRIAKAFTSSGGGKALAIGLGVAAAAGILTTSFSSPKDLEAPVARMPRPSADNNRPEERVAGQDAVPGEAPAGVMAPSNPPRRMVAPPVQARTAVVAPLNQSSDLEVRMRAEDRSAAAETARMAARMASSGGDPNVTVNMRGNNNLKSLRSRERLRELRDQQ